MDRASFLKRALGVVGVLAIGRVPTAPAMPTSEVQTWIDGGTLELGIVRDSVLNTTNEYQIFGEVFEGGGLCAPVTPYYTLDFVTGRRPIRDALPAFSADRGGLRYVTPPALSSRSSSARR